MNLNEKDPLFFYHPPKNKYIGLISIPHSGLIIPSEFNKFLTSDETARIQDVDFYVHDLVNIEALQNAGMAIIVSNILRTCVDLNRSPDTCVLNWKKNSRGIPVVTSDPSENEERLLKATFYDPYYEMLKALILELKTHNKVANIIDLHSMPSKTTAYHMQQNPNQKQLRPDFCLSDQFGKSCTPDFIGYIQNELSKNYPEVLINDPYKGGHITQHIHETYPGVNNIQIEINRALYMDEENFVLKNEHKTLKSHLTTAIIDLMNEYDTNSSL